MVPMAGFESVLRFHRMFPEEMCGLAWSKFLTGIAFIASIHARALELEFRTY